MELKPAEQRLLEREKEVLIVPFMELKHGSGGSGSGRKRVLIVPFMELKLRMSAARSEILMS